MRTKQTYQDSSQNIKTFIAELCSFIGIPSISAESKHHRDVLNCAGWLAAQLNKIGLEHIQLIRTNKHPIVYADWLHATGKPTLLVYGHYDVQPVDPLNEWIYPPFSGTIKSGFIHGRGSSDDKGQLFAHIKAIEYFLRTTRKLPVNIKCLFEGEEEIGSPGLQHFIGQHPAFLKADVAVVSDMSLPSADQPAITTSLRGALSFELEVTGQKSDLHSGTFGGAINNPPYWLCKILSGLQDQRGAITIAGFYDDVQNISAKTRAYMRSVNRSDKEILRDAGASCGKGETGYSLYERIISRPSLSINGITAGYQGEGPKAIIPAKASAKVSFRLVDKQDPTNIEKLFREHLKANAPECLKLSLRKEASAEPVSMDTNNIYVVAAAKAYQQVFKRRVIFQGSGGTIPVVNLLYKNLSMPVILMGFALPDDNPHGPNEKFSISAFIKGIATSIQFMIELGKTNQQRAQ